MISTTPAASTTAYSQQLTSARTDLGQVHGAQVTSPAAADGALAHLHGAFASIHAALAGASSLPASLAGGVTSYPRAAAELMQRAAAEVTRATHGSPVDVAVIDTAVADASARLTKAIDLIAFPPTDVVYDGS